MMSPFTIKARMVFLIAAIALAITSCQDGGSDSTTPASDEDPANQIDWGNGDSNPEDGDYDANDFVPQDEAVFPLFINASDALWVSWGTEQETFQLAEDCTQFLSFIPYGGNMYFVAICDEQQKIYRSNGTKDGTKAIYTYPEKFAITDGRSMKYFEITYNDMIFSRREYNEIIISKMSLSTLVVKDLNRHYSSINDQYFYRVDNLVYFLGYENHGDIGPGLWRSDGSVDGTYSLFAYGYSGTDKFNDLMYSEINGKVMFFLSGSISSSKKGAWASDGTKEGTKQLVALGQQDGPWKLRASTDATWKGHVFFTAYMDSGNEIWKSDGTSDGTKSFRTGEPFDIEEFQTCKNIMYYRDATDNTLCLLEDIDKKADCYHGVTPFIANARYPWAACHNSSIYFTSSNEDGEQEASRFSILNRTLESISFNLEEKTRPPAHWTSAGKYVYFLINVEENLTALYRTDGTSTGTKKIYSLPLWVSSVSDVIALPIN